MVSESNGFREFYYISSDFPDLVSVHTLFFSPAPVAGRNEMGERESQGNELLHFSFVSVSSFHPTFAALHSAALCTQIQFEIVEGCSNMNFNIELHVHWAR